MVDRKSLTHARQAETARSEAKPYTLRAGAGLYLEIMPNGSKRWRFRHRFGGKKQMRSMGRFPDIGLLEANGRRDIARKLVAQG